MADEWQTLTRLTQGSDIVVERVRLADFDVVIEGRFELPALARLTSEEQVFVMAFVKSHGSIKEMEKTFGISYPTVKNRLNSIAEKLPLAESRVTPSYSDIISSLEAGDITPEEAIRRVEHGDD